MILTTHGDKTVRRIEVTMMPNPLTPTRDQHLISPHNINPESHTEVMRIKEMIKNYRNSG